jgi:hypothetical protein
MHAGAAHAKVPAACHPEGPHVQSVPVPPAHSKHSGEGSFMICAGPVGFVVPIVTSPSQEAPALTGPPHEGSARDASSRWLVQVQTSPPPSVSTAAAHDPWGAVSP